MKMRRALRPRPLTHSLARLSSAGAIAAALHVASAQVVWDGQGADGLWTNPVNWAGNILPTPLDTVSFGTSGAGLVQLNGNQTVNAITFTDSFTLGNLGTPNILTNTLGTVTVDPGKVGTINAVLAGSAGLFVNGGGTLALTSLANIYAGNVTVDGAGTVLQTGYQNLGVQLTGTATIVNSPRTDAYAVGISPVKTISVQNGGEWKVIGPGGNPDGGTKIVSFAGGAVNLPAAYTQMNIDDAGQILSSGDIILRGKGRLTTLTQDYLLPNNLVIEGGIFEFQRLNAGATAVGTRFSILGTASTITVNGGMLLPNTTAAQGRVDNPITLNAGGTIALQGADHIYGNDAAGLNIPLTLNGGAILLRDGFNPQQARLPRMRSLLAGSGTVEVLPGTSAASNSRLVLERGDLALAHTFTGTFLLRENAVVETNPRQGVLGVGNALGPADVNLNGWGAILDLRDSVAAAVTTNTLLNSGTSNYTLTDVAVTATQLGSLPTITVNRNTDTGAPASTGNVFNLGTINIANQRLQLTGANGYGLAANGLTIGGNASIEMNTAPLTLLNPMAEAATSSLTFVKRGVGNAAASDVTLAAPLGVTNLTQSTGTLVLRGTNGVITPGAGGAAPLITVNGGDGAAGTRGLPTFGILHLDSAGTAIGVTAGGNNDRIPDAATVRMYANSTFRLTSAPSVPTTETIGTLTVPAGGASIDVLTTGAPATPVALTVNTLTRGTNSTVNFTGTTLGTPDVATSRVILPGTVDGFLGVFNRSGNEWAKYNSAVDSLGVAVGVQPFGAGDYTQDNTEDLWAAGQHNKQTSAVGVTLTANRTVETLNMQFAAANQGLNTNGNILTLAGGGLINAVNTAGIVGVAGVGGITAGTTTPATLSIFLSNQLDVKVPFTDNLGANLTPGGGDDSPVSVVKSGPGTMRLTHHLLGIGTGNQGGSLPPFIDPTWSSTLTGTWTINEGTLDVHRGQFLGGRPVILNGGALGINHPVAAANANSILPGWGNNIVVNGNAIVGMDDNGESADAGVGGNTIALLGSLTVNNGAQFGFGSFNNMDAAFMNGATFNGRAIMNMGINRTATNGQLIINGAATGDGFDMVAWGAAPTALVLGGGQTDAVANTFATPLVNYGGILRLNKANGTVALPDGAGAEDLVINGGSLVWGVGHYGDLATTNNFNTTNNGLGNGLTPLSPAAILAAGQNQIADGAAITLLLGSVGEADRINNERWARLTQKNGTLNVGLGTMQIDALDVTGGGFGINNGGTLRVGALNLLPGAYSPNITTGAVANPAVQTVLEVGAGGLGMSGQNIIIGGGSSGNLAGAGAVLRLGGNVSAVDDPLNANSYFQGIWIQVGNSFRETGNSKTDLMGGDRTFAIDEDVQFFVSTPLSNGGIIKSGPGALILQPYLVSDFAGAVTVSNGVLAARGNGAFGTSAGGVAIGSGGTVKLESGWSYGDSFSVAGAGAIVAGSNSNVREPGALVSETGNNRILPSATFTLIGGATVASSTVQMPAATPVGAVFPYSRSHFSIESAGGIGGTGLLTLSGAGDGTVRGGVNVTGAGNGVTKDGLGRWVISGASAYDGPTTILAGALRITNAAALGDVATGTTVFGGGALELIGGITIAEPLTLLGAGAGEQSGAVVSVAGTNVLNGILTLGFDATLHAAGTLNLGNTTSVVATGDRSLTLTGAGLGTVQGSINLNEGTLIKNGTGRWTLQGAVTYENIAQLNGGLLVLDYRTNNTSKLNTSALTTLNGGSLSLIGSDTAATTQAIGGFTLLNGHGDISVASGTGQAATLGISALNRTAGGGTINFTLPANGAITTGAPATNGILGGFATVGGQDWAALSGFNIAAFTGYTPLDFAAASDTNNAQLATAGTLLGNVTTNSLKLSGGAGLNLDFNTLTLTSGGLLHTSGGEASITGSGTLMAATAADDLLVHVGAGSTLDIGAPIIGFGTGALVKAGLGTLFLSGSNNFSGPVNIGQGTLAIIGPGGTTHPVALGSASGPRDINVNGGTFLVLGDYDPGLTNVNFVIGQDGGTIRTAFGGQIIINDGPGQLRGGGDLVFGGGGRYNLTGGTPNFPNFTGKVTVEDGVLLVGGLAALGGRAEQTITLKPGAVLINSVGGAVGVLGLPNNIVAEGNNQFYVGGGNRVYLGDIQFNGTNTIALFDRDNPGQERQIGMVGRLSGQNITLNIVGGQGLGQPLYLQSGTNDFTGTINLGANAVLEARMPGSLGIGVGDITINLAQNSRLLLRHWQNADFLANVNVNETAEINSDRLVNYGGGGQHLMGINNLNVGPNVELLTLGGGNTYSTRVAGTATINANLPIVAAGSAVFANGINFAGTATNFDKRGAGTIQLLGPANHTGDTLLQGGVLLLRGANGALPNTTRIDLRNGELRIDNGDALNLNRVPDTANVVLAGGTLRVTGNEAVGNVSAPVGHSVVVFNQSSETAASALTLNGLATSRTRGATLQFQTDFGPAVGAVSLGNVRVSSRILLPGQPDVGAPGIIPWAFGNAGLDFIRYDGTTIDAGQPRGVIELRNADYSAANPAETAFTATLIGLINGANTTTTLTTNRTLLALKAEGGAPAAANDTFRRLNLANFNFTLAAGSMIHNANTVEIGNSSAGTARFTSGTDEMIFFTNAGVLSISNIPARGTSAAMTGIVQLVNNPGPNLVFGDGDDVPTALVKSGGGTLALRSNGSGHTFTGGVFVNGGTLDVFRGNNLGPSTNVLTLASGQLNLNVPDLSSNIVLGGFGHPVRVVGNAIIQVDNNGETTGTGTNNTVAFGTLNIDGPYTLTARGFDSYDMSFNGITMTGRPSIDLIQGNTGGNGTSVILGGVLAGSGFNVLSTGNTASTAATLVIGNGAADSAPNTYNGKLVLVGGGLSGNQNAPVVQLNKAPGTNAITGEIEINGGLLQLAAENQMPDTTDLELNGGAVDFNGRNETIAKVTKRGGVVRTHSAGTAPGNTVVVTGDFINTGTGNFLATDDVQVNSNSTLQINGLLKLDAFTRAVIGASAANLIVGGGLEMTGTTITQNSGAGLNIIRLLGNVQTFAAAAPANLGNSTDSDTFLELDGLRTFTIADGAAGMDFQISSVIRDNTSPVNPGALVKAGPGTMQLQGGGTANSYTGATTINEGALLLFKNAGVNAIGSTLVTVGDGVGGARADRLIIRNSNQINDSADVTVAGSGLLDLGSFNSSEAIASLSGAGAVDLGPGSVLTLAGLANTVFSGPIRGGGGLSKTGTSTLELSGTNEYLGPTIVTAGTLLVTGALNGSTVTVSGGTLAGSGSIGGPVTANGTSFITPGLGGTTTAQLDTGNLNLDAGSTTTFDLNGNVANSLYDQFNVTGTVTLAGNLALTLGYTPGQVESLAVILNDGVDPVIGTFAGFPEGAQVGTFGPVNVFITYFGNADGGAIGNDVLLTVPEPGTAALLAGALGLLGLRRRRSR